MLDTGIHNFKLEDELSVKFCPGFKKLYLHRCSFQPLLVRLCGNWLGSHKALMHFVRLKKDPTCFADMYFDTTFRCL